MFYRGEIHLNQLNKFYFLMEDKSYKINAYSFYMYTNSCISDNLGNVIVNAYLITGDTIHISNIYQCNNKAKSFYGILRYHDANKEYIINLTKRHLPYKTGAYLKLDFLNDTPNNYLIDREVIATGWICDKRIIAETIRLNCTHVNSKPNKKGKSQLEYNRFNIKLE